MKGLWVIGLAALGRANADLANDRGFWADSEAFPNALSNNPVWPRGALNCHQNGFNSYPPRDRANFCMELFNGTIRNTPSNIQNNCKDDNDMGFVCRHANDFNYKRPGCKDTQCHKGLVELLKDELKVSDVCQKLIVEETSLEEALPNAKDAKGCFRNREEIIIACGCVEIPSKARPETCSNLEGYSTIDTIFGDSLLSTCQEMRKTGNEFARRRTPHVGITNEVFTGGVVDDYPEDIIPKSDLNKVKAMESKIGVHWRTRFINACNCVNPEFEFPRCVDHDRCYQVLDFKYKNMAEWCGNAVSENKINRDFVGRDLTLCDVADVSKNGHRLQSGEDKIINACNCVNPPKEKPVSADTSKAPETTASHPPQTASQTASASSVAPSNPPPATPAEAEPPKASVMMDESRTDNTTTNSQISSENGNKTVSEVPPVASQSAPIAGPTPRNQTSKSTDEKTPQNAPEAANGGEGGNSTASQTASQTTGTPMSPETASQNTASQTASPALASASGASSSAPASASSAPSSAPEPAPLSREKREELEKRIQKVKIEIRGSLFIFQEELPGECAQYNWRVVFESPASRKYTIEICEASDHGRVVTKVENQLIYGCVVSQPTGANSTSLVVDNGGLERFEIKQKTVIKIGPLSQDEVKATPREILKCAAGKSCSAEPCQGNECDANLEVKYQTTKVSMSVSIKVSMFVACQVPQECNCVRKCAEDKCGVEKPIDRQPSRPIAPEQVRPNTVSVVVNIGQTPSVSNAEAPKSPKAPVEQKGSVPSTKSQQPTVKVTHDGDECVVEIPKSSFQTQGPKNDGAQPAPKGATSTPQGPKSVPSTNTQQPAVSHDGEECEVEIPGPKNDGVQPAPKNDGVQPAPKQAPQNDGAQPAPKQAPQNDGAQPAPKQAPQNGGSQPAGRPVREIETETTTTVTKQPLPAPKDQPEAARPSGVTPPANGGSAPSRPQAASVPSGARNTTSTSSRIGEPVRVSGAARSAVAGNVLAVVAAMALLL